MAKNKKLELTWFNKDKSLFYDLDKKEYLWVDKKDPRVSEPRILLEKATYGDKDSENLLIKGDNLLALKALETEYRNKIKLVYIDPPFNTGQAFEQYDDGLEHSIWLGMMYTRLHLLKSLLRRDGVIAIHLDDKEMAYCKTLADEVFGRNNYLNQIIVKANSPFGFKHTSGQLFKSANYILLYAKDSSCFTPAKVFIERDYDKAYKFVFENMDKDESKWTWRNINEVVAESLGFKNKRDAVGSKSKEEFEAEVFNYALNNSEKVFRTASVTGGARLKRATTLEKSKADKKRIYRHPNDDMDYMFIGGERVLFYSERIVEVDGMKLPGTIITDIWDDISWEGIAKEGGVVFPKAKKPEQLIKRLLDIATEPGDMILDSFAGSGTTGAVAHKMRRTWIMVEMGSQAKTHCQKRLKAVVDGTDKSGVTSEVNWKGGGGFKYFELGDSLFTQDNDLRLTVLNPKVYNGALIRAVLKLEGFKLLNPDNALHGIAGRTIAHVTEQYINQDYIDVLMGEVGKQADFVIVYAKTLSSKINLPDNVEIRRIPDVLLRKFKV